MQCLFGVSFHSSTSFFIPGCAVVRRADCASATEYIVKTAVFSALLNFYLIYGLTWFGLNDITYFRIYASLVSIGALAIAFRRKGFFEGGCDMVLVERCPFANWMFGFLLHLLH